MNWCQPHYELLIKAVRDRGLWPLVPTAETAIGDIAQSLEQGTSEAFNPLLGSWARINSAMALSLKNLGRGQEILQLRCPCCILVEDGQPHLVENWIDGVTDQSLAHAIEQGLIAKN